MGKKNNQEPLESAEKELTQAEPLTEAEKERALNKIKRRKKLKYGALSTVITAVVIAIVVVINIICNVLDTRYHWNIDLTSSGLYEISEETVSYLNRINQDVDIAVMGEEQTYSEDPKLKLIAETLERFRSESNGHISLEYIDMTKHPEAVRVYSEHYDGNFSNYDVVVKSGELVRAVSLTDLIRTDTSMDYSTGGYVRKYTFTGEQSLISAIMGVTDLNPVRVAFINKTNGQDIFYQYDTPSVVRIKELLEKNNYQLTEVDLANDPLNPQDYDFAVLCAPQNDLTDAQITKLTDFLRNSDQYSRDLVYFSSIYQTSTPNLDAFMEIWGLSFGDSVVYEGNTETAQYLNTAVLGAVPSIPIVSASDNTLNANLNETSLPIAAPLFRPITLLWKSNAGRTTASLLDTADTAFLYPLDEESTKDFDQSKAETGVFTLGAVATTSFTVESDPMISRVIAFGSSWLLEYNIADSKAYENAHYFISVMNTMSGKEAGVTIAEKSLDSTSITITESKAKTIRNITVLFIPLLVAVIGIVVYLRRKNL